MQTYAYLVLRGAAIRWPDADLFAARCRAFRDRCCFSGDRSWSSRVRAEPVGNKWI